jgi:putative inorganic carbon (hco3(-)) transporter
MLAISTAVRRTAVFLDRWHWGVLLVCAPALLFPSPARSLFLLGLPLLWLAAALAGRPPLPRTPLNGALLLLAGMLLVNVFITFSLALSLPKLAGMLLGLAAYFALVRETQTPAALGRTVLLFSLAGAGLAGLGLLGINWLTKVPVITALTAHLPAVIRGLPGAAEGFSANGVAGGLLFVVPLQVALLGRPLPPGSRLARRSRGWLALQIALLALTGGVLILSQSRSGWLGAAVGGAALLFWRGGRRVRWLLLGLAVLAGLGLLLAGPARLSALLAALIGGDLNEKAVQRTELWNYGLRAVRDFPLTGMGLNVFRVAFPWLYGPGLIDLSFDYATAHNHLIQAAVDLGLPGLLAYLLLWLGAARALWQAYQRTASLWLRAVAQGLGAGLLAHFAYGFTDAVSLGTKIGLFFWFSLALCVGLRQAAADA